MSININFTKKQKVFLLVFPAVYCALFLFLLFCQILVSDGIFDIDAPPVTGFRGLIGEKISILLDLLMAPFDFLTQSIMLSSDWVIIIPATFGMGAIILVLYKLISRK